MMKSLKTTLMATLCMAGTILLCHADNIDYYINEVNFEHNKQRATTVLYNRGYQVNKTQLKNNNGKPTLQINAIKNGNYYDIKMDYPSLKIISEKSKKDK